MFRFEGVEEGWFFEDDGVPDSIEFEVDKPIILAGIGLYGGNVKGFVHTADVTVHDAVEEKVDIISKKRGCF